MSPLSRCGRRHDDLPCREGRPPAAPDLGSELADLLESRHPDEWLPVPQDVLEVSGDRRGQFTECVAIDVIGVQCTTVTSIRDGSAGVCQMRWV
jgi:hypothetical protein